MNAGAPETPCGSELTTKLLSAAEHWPRVPLAGVPPAARPFVAALLARALAQRKAGPLLWVMADESAVEDALAAARFFLGRPAGDGDDPFAEPAAAFPLHQQSPYEDLSPDRDATAERLALLFRLRAGGPPALIATSAAALSRRCPPRAAIDSASQLVLVGQAFDRRAFAATLVRGGYLHAPLVEDPGQFAIRGGIVDVFTPQLPHPARIELLGDEVESIRTFDPGSQRTLARLQSFYAGPVQEILLDEETRKRALTAVDRLTAEHDLPAHRVLSTRRALREGVRAFGIESLLPAFYPQLETLFDYLPASTRLLWDDPGGVLAAAGTEAQRAAEAYQRALASSSLAFAPTELYLSASSLRQTLDGFTGWRAGVESDTQAPPVDLGCEPLPALREAIAQPGPEDPLEPLLERLKAWRRSGLRTVLATSRPGRARQLLDMLRTRGLAVRQEEDSFAFDWLERATPNLFARLAPGEAVCGFVCRAAALVVVPDSEIFGRVSRRARSERPSRQALGVKPGDVVVHADFGLARFQGLVKLTVAGSQADYLLLHFRDDDKLYLPVTRMNLIERYSGPGGSDPPLTKLGGKSWERLQQRIRESLLEMADSLVRLEAQRRTAPGLAAAAPDESYRALEASFAFEETDDQRRAIEAVLADMGASRPMDRLICGDVGFGKTEVAIRAAMLCTLSGRQTAVLVPTTLLALQHLATFRARLADHGVRVEMLSRMVRSAEQQPILADLAAGKVDVVIGTHRLLLADVRFGNLGLVIIDEEHRFGVRHKERLKRLRQDVDVLTMTATPLPRTLQLALSGLRDISVIRTPPPGRRSIRTLIARFNEHAVAEAIERERLRGGQVFFLHNWVQSMPAMERFLRRIAPRARIAQAHGQMGEQRLERVMSDFVRREIDVLLCTSIVESGLDIPTANTLIINRADRFGLAQLYQIRGRVGRSAERAWAYFLIPGPDSITAEARARLEALSDLTELGSGYQLASRDLEIRGAGNLLGRAQSGHIAAVGFELYNRLLERAIMEVRGQQVRAGREPELQLPVAGFLPEDYVPELEQRLDFYARLSRAATEAELDELEQELIDRCGPVPEEVRALVELMGLKILLRRIGVLSLETRGARLLFQLDPAGGLDPAGLVRLVTAHPDRWRLSPQGLLELELSAEERRGILSAARTASLELLRLPE